MFGLSPAGRMIMPAVLQSISGGKFSKADVYVWWTRTPEEFDQVNKISKIMIPKKMLK
jgi:membrane-bound inhibitor of C-type lysozyme